MLDTNFFLVGSIKKHIDTLIKGARSAETELFSVYADKSMRIHTERMTEEILKDFRMKRGQEGLSKFDIGYIYAIIEAIKNGPKMLVPSFDDCISLEHTEIKIPCTEYEQPYPALLIEFPYKYYEHMTERWKRPQPKGAIACHVKHANMIIINLIYKHVEFDNITVFFETQDNITIEEAFIVLDNKGVHDEDTLIAKFYQRIIMNLMLIMTALGHQTYMTLVKKRRKHDQSKEIVLVGLKQNIKMFDRKTHGTGKELDYDRKSPHPHWRKGYHRMQPYGPESMLRRRTFIRPVFVCGSRYGGNMTDTGATYNG